MTGPMTILGETRFEERSRFLPEGAASSVPRVTYIKSGGGREHGINKDIFPKDRVRALVSRLAFTQSQRT